MLYDYLVKTYREGEPIFTQDILIERVSRENLNQQFKTLADSGKIRRSEKGIYYIPEKTSLGTELGPSPEQIARYKYIERNDKTEGYYSGCAFANQIGLSTQVPMKVDIVSNRIAAKVREVTIENRVFIVRKAKVPVTSENASVLQLLDLLKDLEQYMEVGYEEAREKLSRFVKRKSIRKEDIDRYIRKFPDSTFRYYYEVGMDGILAP